MGCVGSSIPVAFFKSWPQHAYIFMYAIHEQFIYDHVNNFSSNKKREKKKDNKKAS